MQHSHLYHLHIMVKSDADVIKEFNELVNMTASELEKWLKSNDSTSSGWTNGEGGETVGHNSGTKIVDILERNPEKNKEKYTEDDIKHMRKVVSYNKRHLAQEQHLKQKKSNEELQKTKSYKSLKSKFAPSCPLWGLVSDLVWFGLVWLAVFCCCCSLAHVCFGFTSVVCRPHLLHWSSTHLTTTA